jgi:hypothetical protein
MLRFIEGNPVAHLLGNHMEQQRTPDTAACVLVSVAGSGRIPNPISGTGARLRSSLSTRRFSATGARLQLDGPPERVWREYTSLPHIGLTTW